MTVPVLRAHLACAVLLAWTPVSQLGAQEPLAQPPVFATDLELVNVTATVRDADGRLVSGLKAEDFVLKESGRERPLAFFASASDPAAQSGLALDLALLLDMSGSMAFDQRTAREAAVHFLDSVPRARELLIVFFDHEVQVLRYGPGNRAEVLSYIERTSGGGGTALYDAIARAIKSMKGRAGRRVVVTLSDGEDYKSQTTYEDILRIVRASGALVYPVAFGRSFEPGSTRAMQARSFLDKLAHASGGRVLEATSAAGIANLYQQILEELSGQYVLGFVPEAGDGSYRKIKVDVRKEGLKVRHRGGYLRDARGASNAPGVAQ